MQLARIYLSRLVEEGLSRKTHILPKLERTRTPGSPSRWHRRSRFVESRELLPTILPFCDVRAKVTLTGDLPLLDVASFEQQRQGLDVPSYILEKTRNSQTLQILETACGPQGGHSAAGENTGSDAPLPRETVTK